MGPIPRLASIWIVSLVIIGYYGQSLYCAIISLDLKTHLPKAIKVVDELRKDE